MSIDRPRRIFRSAGRRSETSRAVLRAGLVLLLLGGGTAIVSGQLLDRPSSEAAVITAAPGQVAVIDGDTLRLAGTVVRLSDLSAPPRGQSCAAGPDCGGRAIAALAELVRDRSVACRVQGYDGMGRPAARCDANGQDVNIALVATGWARAQAPDLSAAETDARTHRRGIWLAN